MPGKQLAVWDLTFDQRVATVESVRSKFKQLAKKWCFQLETGQSGYLHYQCRISLFHKKTRAGVLSLLDALHLKGQKLETHELQCTLTETSDEVHKAMKENGLAFYCMKIDSRVEGPWSDRDPDPPFRSIEVALLEDSGLHPWQESVKEDCLGDYDPRHINCVIQPPGSVGKSSFTEWMEYKNYAYEIPPFRLMEDIMAYAHANRNWKAYTIDMPRGMKGSKLHDFYSGIEMLKNGLIVEKRYAAKKARMNRPKIWIFTNTQPDLTLLSKDRWKLWTIDENLSLINYSGASASD